MTNITSTVIVLMWEEVPVMERNGIIVQYEIRYQHSTFDSERLQTMTVAASNLTASITGLEEYVRYSIEIRAFTDIGPGPYSNTVNTTTLQDGMLHTNFTVFFSQ